MAPHRRSGLLLLTACGTFLAAATLATGAGGSSPSAAVTEPAAVPDVARTTSAAPATSVDAASRYRVTPPGSDLDADRPAFSFRGLPSSDSFANSTAVLAGTPRLAGPDSNIVLTASGVQSGGAQSIAAMPATSPAGTTLAAEYPGDVGIDADPSVVLHETFEEGSVAALVARYDSHKNAAGMALVDDHPAGSSGVHALRMTSGGAHPATDLFKSFGTGYEELWFRYYIKYVGAGPWHHSGLWFGGYNPSLSYPYPRAGEKPVGNDRFSIALEPRASAADAPMDFYAYWMHMHSWKAAPTGVKGDYWGNLLIHSNAFRVVSDAWTCYEIHLKLNPDPASGAGAVLELWQNDALVRRFDDAGPRGWWVADAFCPNGADDHQCKTYPPAAGTTPVLLNQQWRSDAALKINHFWPENYNTLATDSSLLLDDIVIARRRIGCTVKR